MSKPIDPLTLGAVWRSLRAAANDAGNALQRTAYSEAVREGRDFSVALYDRRGAMVAQGDFSPGHLGSMPHTVGHVLDHFPAETLREGDAILFNDPWLGSGHLPDFLLTSPIFSGGEIEGYVVSCAHMIDVGGAVPGSQAVTGIDSVHQEGIRLKPMHAWTAGVRNDELIETIEANTRVPDKVAGDLVAMHTCNLAAQRSVGPLVERVGRETYRAACTAILEESEVAMREAIAQLPDGTYEASDALDDCGPDTPPVRIAVAITVDGGELTIDFAGSSPQTASGLNAVANYSKAYCYFVVKALMHGPDLPQNAGSIAPIGWTAPEGCVMNAAYPTGVGARAIMQQRIVDVLMAAFAPIVPDSVMAASSHWANPVLGGVDPRSGRSFVLYDVIVGGWGGRRGRDGVEAMCPSFNIDSIPTEVNERSYPILVERYELIRDSAGAGRWRGGHGLRKDVRIEADDVVLANLGDRYAIAPPGLEDGFEGHRAATTIHRGEEALDVHSKELVRLRRDDLVVYELSSGAGYGDPRERDPQLVARDVRWGLVSEEKAAEIYGVVLADGEIDEQETQKRRAGEGVGAS